MTSFGLPCLSVPVRGILLPVQAGCLSYGQWCLLVSIWCPSEAKIGQIGESQSHLVPESYVTISGG